MGNRNTFKTTSIGANHNPITAEMCHGYCTYLGNLLFAISEFSLLVPLWGFQKIVPTGYRKYISHRAKVGFEYILVLLF